MLTKSPGLTSCLPSLLEGSRAELLLRRPQEPGHPASIFPPLPGKPGTGEVGGLPPVTTGYRGGGLGQWGGFTSVTYDASAGKRAGSGEARGRGSIVLVSTWHWGSVALNRKARKRLTLVSKKRI